MDFKLHMFVKAFKGNSPLWKGEKKIRTLLLIVIIPL